MRSIARSKCYYFNSINISIYGGYSHFLSNQSGERPFYRLQSLNLSHRHNNHAFTNKATAGNAAIHARRVEHSHLTGRAFIALELRAALHRIAAELVGRGVGQTAPSGLCQCVAGLDTTGLYILVGLPAVTNRNLLAVALLRARVLLGMACGHRCACGYRQNKC